MMEYIFQDILDKTVITTVLTAIDAAVGGFEQTDVLRYLKSSLSPLQMEDCDRIENYAITWNITGNRWCADWQYHPAGPVWLEKFKIFVDFMISKFLIGKFDDEGDKTHFSE